MHQYRVTKYNPAFRNAAGAYMKSEWTAYSDIGCRFDGVTLTEQAYLTVESAYLTTVMSFHAEAGFPELRAEGVEHYSGGPHPGEGMVVNRSDLISVCRSVLREKYWCRLIGGDFFVHFGYDYYMYIGEPSSCPGSVALAFDLGLFPEPFVSPHHPWLEDEDDTEP